MVRFLALFVVGIYSAAFGCTAFQLKAEDGAYVYCRTLEFGYEMDSHLLIVPRGTEYMGTAQKGEGLKWKTKYGYVGMNLSLARNLISDGMNEKGLVVGALYIPGFVQYETPDAKRAKATLGGWELTSFLLGTCQTVEEVKKVLPTILVGQVGMPQLADFIFPLHFYIGDQTGAVAIVEYIKGKREVFDNPLGTLTNSPNFDWHLLNLDRYLNLSPRNGADLQLPNWTLKGMGQGTGLVGLPGDFSPPSRFVRAALFSQFAAEQKKGIDAVRLGFHILNSFDIFSGIVQPQIEEQKKGVSIGTPEPEITQWVIVHDRLNLKTYWRTYGSLQIQMADLNKIDFSTAGLREMLINNDFRVEEVTEMLEIPHISPP